MFRVIMLVFFLTATNCNAETINHRSAGGSRPLTKDELVNRANSTVSTIIRMGTAQLRAHGYEDDARNVELTVKVQKGYGVEKWLVGKNVGDHRAIGWVLEIYRVFERQLGEQICKTFRLTDLRTLAYVIPVSFDPRSETWELVGVAHDEHALYLGEYQIHCNPFLSLTAYWVTYVGCTVGTIPAGGFWSLICTPAAWLAEKEMARAAPGISRAIYRQANHS